MVAQIFFILSIIKLVYGDETNTTFYDSFEGEPISRNEFRRHIDDNTTFWCINEVAPCDPDEWRRIDGSCNNLNRPNRGMGHTPTLRLLPPHFSGNSEEGFQLRNSKCGGALPPVRQLRTSLLPAGRVPDQVFTQLSIHFLLSLVPDVLSIHDTVNFVRWKPYCCLPEGQKDIDCAPVAVPNDDPVHRFSNIRCMPLTRPLTYQSEGCLKNDTVPERIVTPTPVFDLSHIYGSTLEALNNKGRLFENGLLKYEMEDGRMWPPSIKDDPNRICIMNRKPVETRCHDAPEDVINSLAGGNIFAIWYWRMHNHIATQLAKVNPCWDDEKLFYTARDINIAYAVQINFYEMWPAIMGPLNMKMSGVISSSPGTRDLYNEQVVPQISAEYAYVLRWFHIVQENEQKMFDADGHYLRSIPLTNITLRTGYLAIDNNFDYITQGTFRQPSGRYDNLVDPDISELGMGPATVATDITAYDLVKNRYFGLAPYVKYLELCNGRPFTTFDDLIGFIKPEMLDVLKLKYKHVEDIDLMAALWVELPAPGSFLPKTMQCLMMDQLARFVVSDRHWYERPNRPHAFTEEQLFEIRKARISRLMCNVGDTVTSIQPSAFLRAGPGNEMIGCDQIPDVDFRAWKDPSCDEGSSSSGDDSDEGSSSGDGSSSSSESSE